MSELVQITGPEIIETTPVKLVQGDMGLMLGEFRRHASLLDSVVREKSLSVEVGGRRHLFYEAWTFLGSMLGVFPVTEWTKPLLDSEGKIQGFEARVVAKTMGGAVVGAAEAQCTRDEKMWGWNPVNKWGKALEPRPDYALRSMAQTRAGSKALRMPLGFVTVLAGYQPTPAEEMPSDDLSEVLGESIRKVQKKKQDWTNTHPGHCTLKGCKEIVMEYQSESKAFPGRFYVMCEGAYNQRLEMLDQGSSNKEANAAVEKHYREWSEPWPRKATTATDGGGPIF